MLSILKIQKLSKIFSSYGKIHINIEQINMLIANKVR